MDASNLYNPLAYGRVTFKELEAVTIVYTRNGENIELKEYVKKCFKIPNDNFHFEETPNQQAITIVSNGDDVVRNW